MTCAWATAEPPTLTPGSSSSEAAIRSAASWVVLVVGRLQPDREVGRVAVAGDERRERVSAKPVTEATPGSSRDPAFDLLDPPRPRRPRSGRRPSISTTTSVDAVAGVLEPLVGDHALGRGIVGAVGVEPVGDPGAEGAGEDEEQGGDHDHATAAAVGESGESVDHLSSVCFLCRTSRR